MKKIIFAITLAFGAFTIQAQGISFFEGTFEEALIKAKEEDKLVFVDAFTTWCGPCKAMSKNIFTDRNVGKYYNDNFINLKLDQEKGEGLDFAKNYDVQFYPSLFFINAEKEVAHKAIGGMDVEDFIAFGKESKNNTTQLLFLQKQYNSGNMEPKLLKNLANAMKVAYLDGSEKVALEYIEQQDEWTSMENVAFIYNHFPSDVKSDLFGFIMAERELFNDVIGDEEMINAKISDAIESTIEGSESENREALTEELFQEFYPESWEQKAENYRINVLAKDRSDEGTEEFLRRKVEYLQTYGSDSWQELNAIAWTIYEKSDNEEQLEAAQSFAMQSIELEENYYNTDTYVWISHKLGDKKAVKVYGPIAIELGKEDDSDVSELENLLRKL